MVVNTGGAASEPGPAMAAVVKEHGRHSRGGGGWVDQGLRSDTILLCGRGERWWLSYSTHGYCSHGCGGCLGCEGERRPAGGLAHGRARGKEFPSNLLLD